MDESSLQMISMTSAKKKAIMEEVKSMLHDKKLPKFLRGEAANIVVYVENRSPH